MTTRAEHLDDILTGLAVFEAYTSNDLTALDALLRGIEPHEAMLATLTSMELLTRIFASQLGTDPAQVRDSVRRRVIRELAAAGPVAR